MSQSHSFLHCQSQTFGFSKFPSVNSRLHVEHFNMASVHSNYSKIAARSYCHTLHDVIVDTQSITLAHNMQAMFTWWHHMSSHDITWYHMSSHGITWAHMASHELTWYHMISHGITWYHMSSHGITWQHLSSRHMPALTWGFAPWSTCFDKSVCLPMLQLWRCQVWAESWPPEWHVTTLSHWWARVSSKERSELVVSANYIL